MPAKMASDIGREIVARRWLQILDEVFVWEWFVHPHKPVLVLGVGKGRDDDYL